MVELIVVIAIMFTMIGAASMSAIALSNADVSKVSRNISQGLARTQQLCMAKAYGYLVIEKDGDYWKMYIDTPSGHESTMQVGSSKKVNLYYVEGDSTEVQIDADALILTFTSSGAMKNRVTAYDTATGSLTSTSSGKVNKIIARNRAGKEKIIEIAPNTGHFNLQ